jgi:hypothetical protein
METTTEPKFQKLIIDKSHFPYPYTNITRKYLIYPIGRTFLILYGNAGYYNAVWLDPSKNRTEKILEGIASSKLKFGNGKNFFLTTGEIGNYFLKEFKFSINGKPYLANEIPISTFQWNFEALSEPNTFLSLYKEQLYEWKGANKKALPLFTEN